MPDLQRRRRRQLRASSRRFGAGRRRAPRRDAGRAVGPRRRPGQQRGHRPARARRRLRARRLAADHGSQPRRRVPREPGHRAHDDRPAVGFHHQHRVHVGPHRQLAVPARRLQRVEGRRPHADQMPRHRVGRAQHPRQRPGARLHHDGTDRGGAARAPGRRGEPLGQRRRDEPNRLRERTRGRGRLPRGRRRLLHDRRNPPGRRRADAALPPAPADTKSGRLDRARTRRGRGGPVQGGDRTADPRCRP